jgi:hypothetical protein
VSDEGCTALCCGCVHTLVMLSAAALQWPVVYLRVAQDRGGGRQGVEWLMGTLLCVTQAGLMKGVHVCLGGASALPLACMVCALCRLSSAVLLFCTSYVLPYLVHYYVRWHNYINNHCTAAAAAAGSVCVSTEWVPSATVSPCTTPA